MPNNNPRPDIWHNNLPSMLYILHISRYICMHVHTHTHLPNKHAHTPHCRPIATTSTMLELSTSTVSKPTPVYLHVEPHSVLDAIGFDVNECLIDIHSITSRTVEKVANLRQPTRPSF